MHILVDTSIWIDYFKSGANSTKLDDLLEDNRVFINDIILAELVPFLVIKKQHHIVELLRSITLLSLKIDWAEIIQWQIACLNTGINGVVVSLMRLDSFSGSSRTGFVFCFASVSRGLLLLNCHACKFK